MQGTMKQELLRTVSELKKREVDFSDTPVLFEWSYEEEPDVFFKLLISEVDSSDIEPEAA